MTAPADLQQYDRWLAWHHASRLFRWEAPAEPAGQDGVDWGDQRLIDASLRLVAPVALDLVRTFYSRLFSGHPHLRQLFPQRMEAQPERLVAALVALAGADGASPELVATLENLGRDHRKFGIQPVHFSAVGQVLLATFADYAGAAWTTEVERAWLRRYEAAANIMIDAARAAADLPPYWYATVEQHVVSGVAAITVLRPHQPYDVTAGQVATIETARLPRVWRPTRVLATGQGGRVTVQTDPVDEFAHHITAQLAVGDVVRLGCPSSAPDDRTAPLRQPVSAAAQRL
ncbi:hypothetical protein Cs7R123_47450 [Catellatospora sp. TT07R-123]|uniref:globin domain-containing protein n=1 Tax=Catellatospora sp. TT07R-123 TaxID=2733863 RepID=UPI001B17226C|nr:globin domain-containing protein [Catellatospora sp. TT07R-123]GHJ47403.1 hypothetical protein Cs7R123_47450 [Catellatospora sp. TT07R-123]